MRKFVPVIDSVAFELPNTFLFKHGRLPVHPLQTLRPIQTCSLLTIWQLWDPPIARLLGERKQEVARLSRQQSECSWSLIIGHWHSVSSKASENQPNRTEHSCTYWNAKLSKTSKVGPCWRLKFILVRAQWSPWWRWRVQGRRHWRGRWRRWLRTGFPSAATKKVADQTGPPSSYVSDARMGEEPKLHEEQGRGYLQESKLNAGSDLQVVLGLKSG